MNAQQYDAIRAILVDQFGWQISGRNAVKWTHNGEASFGLDGSVVVFFRRHADGHPLANMDLGTAATAADVVRIVENYIAEVA